MRPTIGDSLIPRPDKLALRYWTKFLFCLQPKRISRFRLCRWRSLHLLQKPTVTVSLRFYGRRRLRPPAQHIGFSDLQMRPCRRDAATLAELVVEASGQILFVHERRACDMG